MAIRSNGLLTFDLFPLTFFPMSRHLKPPFVGLALLALAAWLHLGPAAGWGTPMRCLPCAIALAALGTSILSWCFAHFLRQRTSPWPGARPRALVTVGPYRFSRNPMYVAATLLLLALALAIGSLPFLIPPAGFFLVMDRLYIPHEERWMTEHIGHAYDDYRRQVRRWI